MSETQRRDRTRELGELFVSVTGDDTVTERQDEAGESSKQAVDADEAAERFEGVEEDGLEDAIDADLDN